VKQGIVIPVYRHGKTAVILAKRLAASGLLLILVDDGNDEETKAALLECAAKTPGVYLVSLKKNSGKGAAVFAGFAKAAELGLNQALQIDADGQHDDSRVSFFLEKAAQYPHRVICGYPEYDETVPQIRLKGRRISNFWASVVTISTELKDVLCGFRVYPVAEVLHIKKNILLDRRMGFDPEILVRLYWKKIYPVYYPVKVTYPENGISNFKIIRDNIRISLTFARLCLGMIFRLPVLLFRKIKRGKENQ
jgi:glycosyltransferase involved in cell wall biosynthesis